MDSTLFFNNLRFWGKHTIVNATPSFILAYIHEWNSLECITAMILASILYALTLAFFTSFKGYQQVFEKQIVSAIVRAGTFLRCIICIAPIPIFLLILLIKAIFMVDDSVMRLDFLGFYGGEFYTGLFSHALYQNFISLLPFHISDVRTFLPTFTITLIQGFLLTIILIALGTAFAPLCLLRQKTKRSRL